MMDEKAMDPPKVPIQNQNKEMQGSILGKLQSFHEMMVEVGDEKIGRKCFTGLVELISEYLSIAG